MNCPRCHGKGFVKDWKYWKIVFEKSGDTALMYEPCQMCQGYGIVSCCDGMCGDIDDANQLSIPKTCPASET